MDADLLNVLVAVVAVGVAIASIRFTNQGLVDQRRHNRLSVCPIPFIACADYEDLLRVKVRNDGIGPMIVRKILAYRRGCQPDHDELVSYMPELPNGLSWSNFSSGYVRSIQAGSELILIELKINESDIRQSEARDMCRKKLSQIEIRVKYTDVYGTSFEDEVRYLDFFGRRLASSKAS